jgi:hypothetical protein
MRAVHDQQVAGAREIPERDARRVRLAYDDKPSACAALPAIPFKTCYTTALIGDALYWLANALVAHRTVALD